MSHRKGTNYNYRMSHPPDGPTYVRREFIEALIAKRCAEGNHKTETDPETGDEVCRFCGETIE